MVQCWICDKKIRFWQRKAILGEAYQGEVDPKNILGFIMAHKKCNNKVEGITEEEYREYLFEEWERNPII